MWATIVKRYAKGGDKRAKGILSSLQLTLFNALDTIFASKLERAITAGLLCLDLYEEVEINPIEKSTVVQDIISIVGKDSQTDGIRSVVQMMRNLYGCTRKSGKSTVMYARQFQSLALDYVNHCDANTA